MNIKSFLLTLFLASIHGFVLKVRYEDPRGRFTDNIPLDLKDLDHPQSPELRITLKSLDKNDNKFSYPVNGWYNLTIQDFELTAYLGDRETFLHWNGRTLGYF